MTDPTSEDPTRGRVRITSPHTGAQPYVRRSVREEIDLSTGVGEVYIRSLMRTQLRSALLILALLIGSVGALPVAFAYVDGFGDLRLWGVPLAWIILGVGTYPVLWALGWLYVRRAERAEQAFARLVEPR